MSREVSILITARDVAGAVLAKVSVKAYKLSGAVDNLASKAKISFSTFSRSLNALNNGIQIFERIFRSLDNVIGGFIRKAIEFRSSTDAGKASVTAFSDSLAVTQARIGDTLMPLLQGIVSVLGPLNVQFQQWLQTNEKLIQAGVIEWSVDVATALTSGIAVAVNLVVRAWHGWNMIIGTTKNAWERTREGLLKGAAAIIPTVEKVRGKLHELAGTTDELAPLLNAAGVAAATMGAEAGKAGDDAGDALAKMYGEAIKTQAAIDSIVTKLQSGIGGIGVAAYDALNNSIQRGNKSAEEMAAAVAARNADIAKAAKFYADAEIHSIKERLDADKVAQNKRNEVYTQGVDVRIAALQRQADSEAAQVERSIAQREEDKDKALEAGRTIVGIGREAVTAFTEGGDAVKEFFTSIASRAIDVLTDLALQWVVSKGIETAATTAAATTEIAANTAVAATGAASSQAGIPIIGPILAVAAAAAMVAAMIAFSGGFALGGVVPGGIGSPGVDSRLAMVAGGERILTRSERVIYERSQSGTANVGNTSPGPSYTSNFLLMTTSRTQLRRVERDVYEPERRKMRRNGFIIAG